MEIFSGLLAMGGIVGHAAGVFSNRKREEVNQPMKRPHVTVLLVAAAALINTPSTEGDLLAKRKAEYGKALSDLDAGDDEALQDAAADLANLAAAATPPSKADVESASKIGSINVKSEEAPAPTG
jgi:hypothetical protein